MILQHGQEIERIIFPATPIEQQVIAIGQHGVIDIRVQMQNGQMAPVPWFEVLYENGSQQLWNAAHCEGITLAHKVLDDANDAKANA